MTIGPGSRLETYELVAHIGRGGMGDVWLARDLRLDRKVAVKVLPPHLTDDPDRIARFRQEARATSALNDPNVCTIHTLGETDDGRLFIAMEYIDGTTLRQRLASGPTAIPEALDISAQVASGLAAAHTAGVIHRDVKPENVMIRADGLVKILDFGLAKLDPTIVSFELAQSTRTALDTDSGKVMGTIAYMSPEQTCGEALDSRTRLIDSGETHTIPSPDIGDINRVAWFPDGSNLAVSGRTATKNARPAIWSLSILGGNPRKVRDDGLEASVSPDGSQIVFVDGERSHVWVMGANGEEPHQVVTSSEAGTFHTPVYWAGGAPLAYGRLRLFADKSGIVKPEVSAEWRDRGGRPPRWFPIRGSGAPFICPMDVWSIQWSPIRHSTATPVCGKSTPMHRAAFPKASLERSAIGRAFHYGSSARVSMGSGWRF